MAKMDVEVPSVGESITEVSIASFLVAEGTVVAEGDPIVELESDKATMEVPAPAAGAVSFVAKEGDTLAIGAKLAVIDTDAKASTSAPAPAKALDTAAPAEEKPAKKEAAPPVKEESPASSTTQGPGLRHSMDDYLSTLEQKKEMPQASAPAPAAHKQENDVERKPMSKLRKTIAKRLVQVKNETAMLTTFNEVDMSAVMAIRSREKENFMKEYGAKLTFLPFFIKAAVSALKAFPDVNAYIDGEEIVYNKHQHVGIAVSTPTGLVVPVMRNADEMSFLEITQAITDLATKARDRKLTMKDMSGGTFTITNGGVFGSMLSTPIINPPQSAILGMHNIVERPVAINGQVEVRPVMYLALSYDHRIIDGKESVSFLVHMKKMLEEPTRFILTE